MCIRLFNPFDLMDSIGISRHSSGCEHGRSIFRYRTVSKANDIPSCSGDGVYPPLDIWQTADGRWQGAYSVRNEPSVVSRRIWLGNCAESSLRTKVCVPAGTSAAISVLPPTGLPSSQAFGLFTPSKRSLIGPALAVWKRVAARKT